MLQADALQRDKQGGSHEGLDVLTDVTRDGIPLKNCCLLSLSAIDAAHRESN